MLDRLRENLRHRRMERPATQLPASREGLEDREDGEEAIENAAELAEEGESPTMPRVKTDRL